MHGKLSKLHGNFCGIAKIKFQLFLENKILPKNITEACRKIFGILQRKCFCEMHRNNLQKLPCSKTLLKSECSNKNLPKFVCILD